jgi:predicted TIM-barrel fold metal-dependent hydrolase
MSMTEHPLAQLPLTAWRPRSPLVVAQTLVERPRFPVVDAHTHLGRWLTGGDWAVPDVSALLDLMDECGVEAVVQLGDGRWGDELRANLERYDWAHPGRFATFCQVDWTVLERLSASAAADALAASLEASVSAGARGIKIWKEVGLHVRDGSGALVRIDDERLGPLFDAAGQLGVPVAVHTADPVAFFDPIDEHNERLEQLVAVPGWSFADEQRFPRFHELIDALERVVAAHPSTVLVGAHVGCYPENLGWARRMLTTYPNFHVDIGARVAELGRQPRTARRLIVDFPDRVLFGTDVLPDREVYRKHFRFLETDDEAFPHDEEAVGFEEELRPPVHMGRWTISGLHLPDHVLQAVYADNARRLIGGLGGH